MKRSSDERSWLLPPRQLAPPSRPDGDQVWLARNNKRTFGALYVAGVAYALARAVQFAG